jgi:tetratricopeptide (TPR) repeat protein
MTLELTGNDAVFVMGDAQDALSMAMSKQSVAAGSGDAKSRAMGLITAGEALAYLKKYEDATASIQEAQGLCGELKYDEGTACCTNAMTTVFLVQGFIEEAIDSGKDALKQFKKAGYKLGEGMALNSLSKVMLKKGDAQLAIKYAKEALATFSAMGQVGCVAMTYFTTADAYMASGDTFAAARAIGKAAGIYEKVNEKVKAAMAYVSMAGIELKAQDYAKVVDYCDKAKATADGDSKVSGAAAEVMVEMALSKGDIPGALSKAKTVIGEYHSGGDAKLETKALLRLASLYVTHGYHEKGAKVAEIAIGLAYGMNDQEDMAAAKSILDGAKHSKVCEEIEVSVARMQDYCHVPATLIVDPGLQPRVQAKYVDAVKRK